MEKKVKESTKVKTKKNTKENTTVKEKKSTNDNTKKSTKEITKKNTKKIITFLLAIVVVIVVFVVLKMMSNKNEKIMINKSVDINVGGYNQVAMVNYVIDGITVDDNKYTQVNLDIENKKDIDSNTSYHQFYLVDGNGGDISLCYHEDMIDNNNFTDIFPNVIKANSHTQGNLYCPSNGNDIGQLKIKVISGGSIEKDKINYEYNDYYVDLKK